MKRINTIMIVGLIAGTVLLAGCKKEHRTVTLGATIDNSRDAKVYIDNLTPCWHNNDQVRVNNQTCATSGADGSSAQITEVTESANYRAIYPADLVGDVDITSSSTIAVTLPQEQQYEADNLGDQKVKAPMGAFSRTESLTFYNLCSLIKVVISNSMANSFDLERITVTAATAYLSGACSATVTGSPNDQIGNMATTANHDVSLVFQATNRPTIGNGDRDTYVYYIVAPAFGTVEDPDNVTITLHTTTGQYATFEKPGVSLGHNKMATVSLTVSQLEGQALGEGVLPGAFSVSGTRQVHFSRGNLQYEVGSDNNWRFAEHQYDYVGIVNQYFNSQDWTGWIDLFGWGTGNNPTYNAAVSSWSSNPTYSQFTDWGENAISNGGNQVNLWRTLDKDEWNYMLNSRDGATSKRGTGNINGVGGLIILPDEWTLPSGGHFNSGFPTNDVWTRNSYTVEDWALMEAAGAVFLPAAGVRQYPYTVGGVGTSGRYWSSTPSNSITQAYRLYFISTGLYQSDNSITIENRNYGCSVRLVQNISNNQGN